MDIDILFEDKNNQEKNTQVLDDDEQKAYRNYIKELLQKANIINKPLWDEIIPYKTSLDDKLQIISVSGNENINTLVSFLKKKNVDNNNRYLVKTYSCRDFLTDEVENNYYVEDTVLKENSDFYDADLYTKNDMTQYSNILFLLNRYSNIYI